MTVVPFKARTAAPPVAKTNNSSRVDLASMLVERLRETGVKSFFLDIQFPMQQHLNSLQGLVKDSHIDDWKKALRTSKDAELKNIAETSTKLDWSKRPAYFRALLAILAERNIGKEEEKDQKPPR